MIRQRFTRFGLVAALLCTGAAFAPAAARDARAPGAAPSFALPARAGTVSLDSLRGRVVYLDFWASWCGPCRASFPWMAGVAERYRSRGLAVVAVNLDKDRALAEAFLAEHLAAAPAGLTVAFDPAGGTATAYKVAAMPSSFVIGRDGALLLRHAGFDPRRTRELEQAIDQALAR